MQKCWIDNRFDEVDGQWRILVKRNINLGTSSIEEPVLVIYINLLHCQLLLCHFYDMVVGARLNFEV